MNFAKNGSYYIIAKYRDFEKPEIIPLRQSWYLEGGSNDFIYGNDIAAIDIVTTKFSCVDSFKMLLDKEGLLKNDFVDLYIVHSHKYHGKEYLNTYELLFNQKDYRTELITKMGKNRLNRVETKQKDTDSFYNRFFNKVKTRESFRHFFELPFKPNSEYFSLELSKYENPFKLKYSSITTDYITTRNIANMWNLYDTLSRRYDDMDEVQKGKRLAEDFLYLVNMRVPRRIDEAEILKLIDKNQVVGQITMEDYLNSTQEEQPKKTLREKNQEEKEKYEQGLKNLYIEERRIREEVPFDDPALNKLAERFNVYEIVSHISDQMRRSLTPKDMLKLGMINIVEYHNKLRDLARKENKL